ncbi:holin, partial [Pseudomonas phage vB_Pae_BR52b]
SWIVGYYVAGEVIGREWARTSGLVAFGGALFCVAVGTSVARREIWRGFAQ